MQLLLAIGDGMKKVKNRGLNADQEILLILYQKDSRTETIENLEMIRNMLTPEEAELYEMIRSLIVILKDMTDEEFLVRI